MPLDEETLDAILSAHFGVPPTNLLGNEPEINDLLKFIRGGMATKRLRKKFLKDPDRYAKRVHRSIWREWQIKRSWKLEREIAEWARSTLTRPPFSTIR